jgi:hypothetical protein
MVRASSHPETAVFDNLGVNLRVSLCGVPKYVEHPGGRKRGQGGCIAGRSRKLVNNPGYEHPVVAPHDSHLRQVPLRTSVSEPHSGHGSPS